MLKNWIEGWDRRIASWIEQGPECDMGLGHILRAYKGNEKNETDLELYALPEPYVGDPVSDDPLDAVLLMLNPGGSCPEQWRHGGTRRDNGEPILIKEDGALVKKVQSKTYYHFAKEYLLDNTKEWWVDRRSRWPARLLGLSKGTSRIVGIDLIPWHSKKFGSIEVADLEVLRYFRDNVLTPAAILSEKSQLSINSGIGLPIVLAIGSQHAHYLELLGFKLLKENKQYKNDFPEWPIKNAKPVKRNIRLFVAKDNSLAVLQTDAQGGFKPPRKDFDPIVRNMLSLLEPADTIAEPAMLT